VQFSWDADSSLIAGISPQHFNQAALTFNAAQWADENPSLLGREAKAKWS